MFLIDLKRDPVDESSLDESVPDLVRRCKRLNPDRIILIKTNVYDIAFSALREANLPVVNERIPFPGSGQQKRFEKAFASALKKEAEGGALTRLLALSSDRTSCCVPYRSCRRAAAGRQSRRDRRTIRSSCSSTDRSPASHRYRGPQLSPPLRFEPMFDTTTQPGRPAGFRGERSLSCLLLATSPLLVVQ